MVVTCLPGFTPQVGDSWRIIEGFNTDSTTTVLNVESFGSDLPSGYHWTVQDDYAVLSYGVVPEPSTAFLLGLAVLTFATGSLRRRSRGKTAQA